MSNDAGGFAQGTLGPPLATFRAYRSANQAGTAATFVRIQYDTISFDQYGLVTVAPSGNQGFIIPTAGLWLIFAKLYATGGSFVQQQIFKNGTAVAEGTYSTGDGTNQKVFIEDSVQVNGSDLIEIRGYGSGTPSFQGGTLNTYVYGIKVA
jgi:hypothetical protein